jgi:hypothetical protein
LVPWSEALLSGSRAAFTVARPFAASSTPENDSAVDRLPDNAVGVVPSATQIILLGRVRFLRSIASPHPSDENECLSLSPK